MTDSEKTSVAKMILQSVEDFATIVKGEIDIAKKHQVEVSFVEKFR